MLRLVPIRSLQLLPLIAAACAPTSAGARRASQPALPAVVASIAEVAICNDDAGWPPFTYVASRDSSGAIEVKGYSVDVITAILHKAGIPFRIDLLPWKRCLNEVSRGENYQVALEASFTQERARTYWLSRPFYKINSHVFYSRRSFPQPPTVRGTADLANFRICGLRAYNYETYGLNASQVDQTSGNHAVLVKRLKLGRCDLFIEKIEVLVGSKLTGQDLLADPDLGHLPLPGFPPSEFHMLVSRKAPQGAELLQILNAGIAEMESNHQLERLWAKHLH
jgi:polar amino acid transport system substrate-binding protein